MTESARPPAAALALPDAQQAPAAAAPLPPVSTVVTHIGAAGRWPKVDVRELWAYRGLAAFLTWRDVKVRYAQTALGAAWAVLQPLLNVLVFTVIFGRFAKVPSDGVPYPLFSLAALVPWTYFSTSLTGATGSLVANTQLITKVYFPRLVVPFAAVLGGLVDFAVSLGILIVMMIVYRVTPAWHLLPLLPVLVLAMMLTAAGIGAWLAALNIKYRDVRYITPFLVQIWMYASPVVYPLSVVPERYRWIVALNPLTGVIEGFRAVLLGTTSVAWGPIAASLSLSVVAFIGGVLYFRSMERQFADVA